MSKSNSLPRLKVVDGGRPADAPADDAERVRARSNSTLRLVRDSCRKVIRRAFGRYELLVEMGRGGMATLYLARIQGPQHFEKLLAIKRIHEHLSDETDFVRMFGDEARIAALIHHPNVATIFDMGEIDGAHFIAMEYVHGQNLTDLLKAATRHRERFPWTHAIRIVADAAEGLHAAHTLRSTAGEPLHVVHRDVSPHNILVSYDGHVKVVDFGIAYAAEKLHHTGAGTLKGKVGYMAPEQTTPSIVDHRADIFALGVVLFEAVTISRLFQEATDAQTLLKVRAAQVVSPRSRNPDLPPELERIILKCLARRPEDRFDSAEELSERLTQLLIDQGHGVPRQALRQMMNDVFYDRKKIKDQQIRVALTEPAPVPLEGMCVEETSSSLLSPAAPREARRKARRGLFVGALVGALLTAVALTLVLTWRDARRSPSPRPSPATPAATEPPRSSKPGSALAAHPRARPASTPAPPRGAIQAGETVTVRVSITPHRARPRLMIGGRTYEGSDTLLVLPRSTAPQRLVVTAAGYRPHSATLVPSYDHRLEVELTPNGTRAAMKRRARRRSRRRSRRRARRNKRVRHRPRAMLWELPD